MPCGNCKKDDMMSIAWDSVGYYLILSLRERFIVSENPALMFNDMEKWTKTIIFAGGTYAFDNMMPDWIKDWFMSVGSKFGNSMSCAHCIARNVFLVVCALIYERYLSGSFNWETDMWLVLDEFVRLSVGDIAMDWIGAGLKMKGYQVQVGDVRVYSRV